MIKENELVKAAHLSRIKLTEKDQALLLDQVSKILGHFNELQKINTDGVEPMVTPSEMDNLWREDSVKENSPDQLLGVAPDIAEGQFKVPQVV